MSQAQKIRDHESREVTVVQAEGWPGIGFAEKMSMGWLPCWSEQAGACVRCPVPEVMSTELGTATIDSCAG